MVELRDVGGSRPLLSHPKPLDGDAGKETVREKDDGDGVAAASWHKQRGRIVLARRKGCVELR